MLCYTRLYNKICIKINFLFLLLFYDKHIIFIASYTYEVQPARFLTKTVYLEIANAPTYGAEKQASRAFVYMPYKYLFSSFIAELLCQLTY